MPGLASASLRRLLSWLLDALAPPACLACDAPTSARAFCSHCGHAGTVASTTIVGTPLIVAGRYEPPLSTAIVRLKFENRPELARPLARLLLPRLREHALPPDAVLAPVPLHPRRLVTRGYNQAALLAQELSGECGLICQPRLLRRRRDTAHQVGKTRDERELNARDAFELRQPGPARVVLVDDVVTTGSTVRACAQALAEGGAELSAVIALAQAGSR